MQIHNFYSDLLLSVKTLFDKIIFPSKLIKSYSFNIANRAFELSKRDYKPNYELPAAIVRLEEDEYMFGERPNVVQNHPIYNNNMVPVLVDSQNENKIYLQEEHVNTTLTVTINCESQFEAKEIEFTIKRFLPLNKYINLFSFTSFLEIDPNILLSNDMDFNDHEIVNLFTRLNKNVGEIEYCFSVSYSPMIYLSSVNSNISNSSERSFSVECSISFLIQIPVWMAFDKFPGRIERINLDFTRFGHDPISDNSMRTILEASHSKQSPKTIVRRNLVVHDLNDFSLTQSSDNSNYIFSIQFNKDDFIISPDDVINIFDIYFHFHHNIKPILVDTENNEIRFEFDKNNFSKFNATITNPIVVQFAQYV